MTTIEIPVGSNLDPYFKANRKNTRFVLGAGQYFCESAWNFVEHDMTMVGPGCSLIGSGSRHTLLTIGNSTVPEKAWQIENLTAGSRSGASDTVELSGFTLMCATDVKPASRIAGQIGVHVWSDRARIQDLEIRGIWGQMPKNSKDPSQEGFGLLLNGPGGRENCYGGSVVENVRVLVGNPVRGLDGPNYVTGFYAGYVIPAEYTVARNISVRNCCESLATVAFGVNSKVLGSGWTCQGRWGRGIYCDVSGGRDVLIGDSVFDVEQTGVEFHGNDWRDITVFGCRFNVRPGPKVTDFGAGLVLVHLDKKASFENVLLCGCILQGLYAATTPLWAGSCTNGKTKNVGLRKCEFIGTWKGQATNEAQFTIT